MSGHHSHGRFVPGRWIPIGPAPANYVFVNGFWAGNVYVDGYYRPIRRSSTMVWVEGYYRADGSYQWGFWAPRSPARYGYVWVAGFYDGRNYVEGFYRPSRRSGYSWINANFDRTGYYRAGHWAPVHVPRGRSWNPGFYDGQRWNQGSFSVLDEVNSAPVQVVSIQNKVTQPAPVATSAPRKAAIETPIQVETFEDDLLLGDEEFGYADDFENALALPVDDEFTRHGKLPGLMMGMMPMGVGGCSTTGGGLSGLIGLLSGMMLLIRRRR